MRPTSLCRARIKLVSNPCSCSRTVVRRLLQFFGSFFFTSLIAIYFFNTWIPTLLSGSALSNGQIVVISTALQFGGIVGTLIAAPIVLRVAGFLTAAIGYFCAAL